MKYPTKLTDYFCFAIFVSALFTLYKVFTSQEQAQDKSQKQAEKLLATTKESPESFLELSNQIDSVTLTRICMIGRSNRNVFLKCAYALRNDAKTFTALLDKLGPDNLIKICMKGEGENKVLARCAPSLRDTKETFTVLLDKIKLENVIKIYQKEPWNQKVFS